LKKRREETERGSEIFKEKPKRKGQAWGHEGKGRRHLIVKGESEFEENEGEHFELIYEKKKLAQPGGTQVRS